MDKTTTWLVRGAAIVVISSGLIPLFSFLKPKLNQFSLSREEKEKIVIEKAEKRCEKLPILYENDFMKMLKNNEIKKPQSAIKVAKIGRALKASVASSSE